MCFTVGASAVLCVAAFATSYYEWRCFKCWQYSLGIFYWGIMEFVQIFQHMYAAGPEDNYAMCENPINKNLTKLSNAHLVFQPAVVSLGLMSLYRRHDIEARIIGDFLFKLALLSCLWFPSYAWICHLTGTPMELLPPSTEDCPNYQWMAEGYDGFLKQTTPNVPGQPCVYYAPTETGHLAWAIPIHKQTYFFSSPNVHFLMFFGPYIVMTKYPVLQGIAFLFWITGPYLAHNLTPSVNEQPAIWCFFSVAQSLAMTIIVRWKKLYEQPVPARIYHPGTYGEEPLSYDRNNAIVGFDGTTDNNQNNGLKQSLLPLEQPKNN